MTERSSRGFRLATYVAGSLFLGYLVFSLALRGRVSWFGLASDAALLGVNLLATLALAYAAVRSRVLGKRLAWAWGVLALAQFSFSMGDMVWLILQSRLSDPPFPSVADGFYLAYYPLFAAGLLLLPAPQPSAEQRLKNTIDLAIVILGSALIGWNFLVAPLVADNPNDRLATFLLLAYPVLSFGLFYVLLRLVYRRTQDSRFGPVWLLELGVLTMIVADVIFTLQISQKNYLGGGAVDFAYMAAYLLTSLAGVRQGLDQPDSQQEQSAARSETWATYLPYLLGILSFFLLVAYDRTRISFPVMAIVVGVIFTLIIWRQVVSMRENARLYENELRRRRLAEALGQAGREVSGNLDFDAVPGLILDQLATVLPYERCSIMIEEKNTLIIAAQRGFPADERTKHLRITIRPDDVFLEMARTRQPVVYPDVTQVPGWQIVPWLPLNKSWMGVPLIGRDRIIGMLSITRRPADAFSPDDALLATAFAAQAAIALENARLYDQLNQAYHNLEILDHTKSRFIEVVAHELRTPLTIIKGYSQALSSQPSARADPQYRPYLDGILRGIDRMHETVNDMLAVTKIDAQELKLRKKPTLLSIVVGEAISKYESALQERRLTLIVEGLKGMPPIEADPDLLSKVFQHLVMNAIKYTPDGGKITITGALDEASREVEVIVSDTGIGIDPAQHQVIFEKFYQGGEAALHSSGKTKFKGGGPGLGLAIARGIVVAHGGKIWVESPGCDEATCPGSQFHVRLPM